VQVWSLQVRNKLEVLLQFRHIIPFLLYLHDARNLQSQFDEWVVKLQEQEVIEESTAQ
jgi:hypothetical protein